MDTINSFKGYGKVDDLEQAAFRSKIRKRIIILAISSLLLIALIIGVVAGTVVHNNNKSDSADVPSTQTSPPAALKSICSVTQYPDSCYSSLGSSKSSDPEKIFQFSLSVVMGALEKVSTFPDEFMNKTDDPFVKEALSVCGTVLNDAVVSLNDSISAMNVGGGEKLLSVPRISDLQTWLSTVVRPNVLRRAGGGERHLRGGNQASDEELDGVREQQFGHCVEAAWVSRGFQDSNSPAAPGGGGVGIPILGCGGGPETPPGEHPEAGRDGGEGRQRRCEDSEGGGGKNSEEEQKEIRYIREGRRICGECAVAGKGFIARDIGFKNTAGAIKHQAVALRSGSDQSVFYRCLFDAFQDTLPTGKKDPNQNTGISIQRCVISPLDRLTAPTYLGRPWKDFSTTVIMQTNIGGFLSPLGWISWVSNVDPPRSIFYAEYQNTGPGSSTRNRVKWAGYRPTLTAGEASKYNVQSFIQGPSWLSATTVSFDST
ncbi:Pectinesterase 3 [Sesamum angolense]|uniref:Pectinesterase 3 n=1 Tax=Sesamum angolense TaxID=2727404 RepID=A0AAE1WKH2_9LAMI|nr:Pectinesterase 3 [Sesamum angolense]